MGAHNALEQPTEQNQPYLKVIDAEQQNVKEQLDDNYWHVTDFNRGMLQSVISAIVLYGTQNTALRGNSAESGNLNSLLRFCVETS